MSSSEQVRELDRRTIEQVGVPGIALMEVASRGVARAVRQHHAQEARRGVVVVCGPGNNGGDGYGAARWLHSWGVPVRTVSLEPASRGDAAVMRAACGRLGIQEVDELGDCGVIVDAVFGTGLTRTVEGAAAARIDQMNAHSAPVIAVDVPSGLCSDRGRVLGRCVRAERTVTFGRHKIGLLMGSGPRLAGEVVVVDIGLDAAEGADALVVAEIPEAEDLAAFWPKRPREAHKGVSGHLLIVAGSTSMAGAAVLASRAALRAGAGLVSLLVPAGVLPRLGALSPEVMVVVGGTGDRFEEAPGVDLSRFDAVLAGPGLGGGRPLSQAVGRWLERLWRSEPRPVVFDADALPHALGGGAGPRVITPHPGEAARMLGCETASVVADRLAAVESLQEGGRVALLKGPNTLVAGGGTVSINPTGGPVLATGGSGDVLAGVIGALLCRGATARDSARMGAWVHGAAADHLASKRHEGWTASEVADGIPVAIAALLGD